MLRLAIVLSCAFSLHLLAAGDNNSEYGPLDIEVRLRDGSQMHGELIAPADFKLKTAYGVLTFPVTDLRQIRFGLRLAEKELRSIQEAIALLDSDDFGRRDEAQKILERLGAGAVTPLKAAREASKSIEVRNRIDHVLKRLAKKDGGDQSDDQVSAADLDVTGLLDLKEFRFKSPFGELTVKIEDVDSVRWLAGGRFKVVNIEARKGLENWIDTGVNVSPGEPVGVTASGSIHLFGYQVTPTGSNNWSVAQFMVGSLIGRVGKDGEQFLVGDGKKWTGAVRDRLYVKIFCGPEQLRQLHRQPPTGSYRVRVATGVRVGELDKPNENAEQQNLDAEASQQ